MQPGYFFARRLAPFAGPGRGRAGDLAFSPSAAEAARAGRLGMVVKLCSDCKCR
jgi:hypothetical protein